MALPLRSTIVLQGLGSQGGIAAEAALPIWLRNSWVNAPAHLIVVKHTGGDALLGACVSPAGPAGSRSDRGWQKAGARGVSTPDKIGTSMAAPSALCPTFRRPCPMTACIEAGATDEQCLYVRPRSSLIIMLAC